MLFSKYVKQELLRNSEYQSALIRLGVWCFSIVYIGLGAWTDYYNVNLPLYYLLFIGYFLFFIATLISVYLWPVMVSRPYITLFADISAGSLSIFLTQEAFSPFFLIYIWIFVSYGTRYGKRMLTAASIFSVAAYILVLVALRGWQTHTFEAIFFLILLVLLPLYQYSLLRKLHAARQEAERANKAKGDFLATMTHELRTPLIGILGMARLMQGTPLDAEQKEYLHSIRSSAQLLRALIGDILDFSKIDANKLELIDEFFDIRQLVRNVTSSLANEAHEKHLEVRCWIDRKLPSRVRGDQLRVSQILFNLLGNAIKFTEQGSIMLRVSYAPSSEQMNNPHVLIEVEDTGIGIPQDKLDKIFDMFWQLDGSNNRRFAGTGLGATVARDLSRRMGGDISVRSRIGVGTTFSVHLPMLIGQVGDVLPVYSPLLEGKRMLIFESDEQNMALNLKIAEELGMLAVAMLSLNELTTYLDQVFDVVLVCDSLAGIPLTQVMGRLEALPGRPQILLAGYRGRTVGTPIPVSRVMMKPFLAEDLADAIIDPLRDIKLQETFSNLPGKKVRETSGIKILLAEDNVIAAKVLSTLLLQRGHDVHVAKDGAEALEALAKSDYHLAFIDLRMPRVDGIEFARLYRMQEAADSHLPIFALSANTAEDAMANCIEAGMDGFLNKPIEPEQLDAIIERFSYSCASSYG